jgi:hypothetical protein
MLKVLFYAERHCLCPSPFDNICQKCQDFAEIKNQKAKEIARALAENLVYVDNYNHMVLLPRGYNILQNSRGKFADAEEED